jgi:hypothetical protein
MFGVDTSRAAIKRELAEWYALAERDANAEANTFAADHTAADERWFAEATRDDEPVADDADWDAFDDFVVECGPDPEIDFHALMGERWTIA